MQLASIIENVAIEGSVVSGVAASDETINKASHENRKAANVDLKITRAHQGQKKGSANGLSSNNSH